MKGNIFTIIGIWVITFGIGIFVWETKTDIAQGVLIALGVTSLLMLVEKSIDEYLSKHEYKEEYYIKW